MAKRQSKRPNIDGISQRTPRNSIGDFKNPRPLGISSNETQDIQAEQHSNILASDDEIESMTFEDDKKPPKKSRRQQRKERKQQEKEKKRKKDDKSSRKRRFLPGFITGHPVMSILMLFLLPVLLVSGFLGMKFYFAHQNIFDRGGDGALALRSNLDPSELNGEGDGRVNILIAGIGGEGHPGGDLADTIIIASIDPFAKEVAMLSVPRDMYVDIPDYWSTRINAAHSIGEEFEFEGGDEYPDGGMGLLEKTLEETLDIPIHYYLRVDFSAFKHAVDAVDGIVLDVETPVYDPTFVWEWQALDVGVGEQYFDGERALFYARSRKTSAGGDFDRADRQRDIIIALKDKVLSLGTYSNPLKIAGLIDAVGNGVKTNLSISEILRLYEIGGEITSDKVVSVGLDTGPDGYLAGQNIGGASVLVPIGGDYSQIQEFVRSIFVDGFIKSEAATVEVFNGTAREGYATEYATELGSYGYDVVNIDNIGDKTQVRSQLFDLTDLSPYSKRYLEQRVGVVISPKSELPEELRDSQSDFIIILGTDVQETQ